MYYSVASGRSTGIYTVWAHCSEAVKDFPGAVFRKWESLREATQHLNRYGIRSDDIVVREDEASSYLLQYCQDNGLLFPSEVPYDHQTLFKLGGGVHVGIGVNNGVVQVQLNRRDFNTGLDKGDAGNTLLLDWDCWTSLLQHQQSLEDCFVKLKRGEDVHVTASIGRGHYVSVDSPYPVFNIRLWYNVSPDVEKPTRWGITLSEKQWSNLTNLSGLLELSYRETLRKTPNDAQSI